MRFVTTFRVHLREWIDQKINVITRTKVIKKKILKKKNEVEG